MSFLLDTNICSAHLRRPTGLAHRFMQHSGRLYVPSIVFAELFSWANRRDDTPRILGAIQDLMDDVQILDFDLRCSAEFGRLDATLGRRGIVVPAVDLMIASVALVHDLTVVTHNTRDFCQVPDLRVADWLDP